MEASKVSMRREATGSSNHVHQAGSGQFLDRGQALGKRSYTEGGEA